jgi:ribonuclease HI
MSHAKANDITYKSLTSFTDGGARGNPGPAAIGVAIYDDEGNTVHEVSEYLGHQTNNYAEYTALVRALKEAKKLGAEKLSCFLDSELVVKQLAGEYRVKNEDLRVLFEEAKKLACDFTRVTFEHVRREKNKAADRLVNEALDSAQAEGR